MPMTTRRFPAVVALALLSVPVSHAFAQNPPPAPLTLTPPANAPFKVEVIADFESPWAMTFLPDGRMLITEEGRARCSSCPTDGRQRKPVSGIPPVSAEGQGGLMDVVLHPKFAQNKWVYFSYSEAGRRQGRRAGPRHAG